MTVIQKDRARNRSNLQRIKKEFIRIATGNPADFHDIDLDEEEDNDYDDEPHTKHSLLDSIRSSETVQSISFLKRMNPFIAWNESKYKSKKTPSHGMGKKEGCSNAQKIGTFWIISF